MHLVVQAFQPTHRLTDKKGPQQKKSGSVPETSFDLLEGDVSMSEFVEIGYHGMPLPFDTIMIPSRTE